MRSNYVVDAFRDVKFFMVCDVVCTIDIPNSVNLSLRDLMYVLVGWEISMWVIGIVGVFF